MRYLTAARLRFALILVLATLPRFSVADEPLRFEPQEGVLVLINGQTLSGKITRAGDRYCVVLKGGEINLSASQVVLHCRDLQEAYQRQSSARIEPRIHDHVKLATWCIQNKLTAEAHQELDAGSKLEPNNAKIANLRRRLEMAKQSPQKPVAAPAVAPVPVATLEHMVRSMPPGAMEGYTSTVQPLLLNQCATAACHGAQSKQTFKLSRAAGGAPPSRRLTQRNLYELLKHIDLQLPGRSEVLKAAGEPHGPTHTPILKGRDSEQFRQLAAWVRLVSQTPDPKAPAVLPDDPYQKVHEMSGSAPVGSQGDPSKPIDPSRFDATLTAQWSQIEGDEEFRVGEDGSILTSVADEEIAEEHRDKHVREKKQPIRGAAGMVNRPNVKRGAVPQVISRDPHDPELFNRQFHPQR